LQKYLETFTCKVYMTKEAFKNTRKNLLCW
jgi:hypothetical protein